MDHGRFGPRGVLGGADGGRNRVRVSAPGGGYGDPLERDPQRVAGDVARGYYTPEQAAERFGVQLDSQGEVDDPGTTRLRAQRRREMGSTA